MKRTYVDAGVLMRAARGDEGLSGPALGILCDPERELVSSVLVRLEVLPRATGSEVKFYETYFKQVAIWAPIESYLMTTAVEEAQASGISPLDAIHVVLAASTGCHELVTAEKEGAAIYGTKRVSVVGVPQTRSTDL